MTSRTSPPTSLTPSPSHQISNRSSMPLPPLETRRTVNWRLRPSTEIRSRRSSMRTPFRESNRTVTSRNPEKNSRWSVLSYRKPVVSSQITSLSPHSSKPVRPMPSTIVLRLWLRLLPTSRLTPPSSPSSTTSPHTVRPSRCSLPSPPEPTNRPTKNWPEESSSSSTTSRTCSTSHSTSRERLKTIEPLPSTNTLPSSRRTSTSTTQTSLTSKPRLPPSTTELDPPRPPRMTPTREPTISPHKELIEELNVKKPPSTTKREEQPEIPTSRPFPT